MKMNYKKYILSRNGLEHNDNWTEISDIGRTFGGEVLTDEIYSKGEDCYVRAMEYLMEANGIHSLRIGELSKFDNDYEEKYNSLYSESILSLKMRLAEGYEVDKKYIGDVVKLMLRGDIWCRLYARNAHFIADVGYDFSMHIICKKMRKREFKNIQAIMSKSI